jgi:hypothetical protein
MERSTKQAKEAAIADIKKDECRCYIHQQSRIRDAAVVFSGVFVSISNLSL